MLEIGDLHVSYGQVDAVRGVSLSLLPGQIVSVIGPNGAGKTTLLGAVMGLLPATGTLRFEGVDLHGLDVEARVERGLCLVPEKRELFGELSVLDNLMLGAYTQRRNGVSLRGQLDAVYARFPRLGERLAQRADTLSGGERQMLALGRALMSSPRLLMLDEPSLGLAPVVVKAIFENLAAINRSGTTILLVEQNVARALELSQRGYVLENGAIGLEGSRGELLASGHIKRAYLGL
jgi:branched-chain amino acid transport system ATP-binding protein